MGSHSYPIIGSGGSVGGSGGGSVGGSGGGSGSGDLQSPSHSPILLYTPPIFSSH